MRERRSRWSREETIDEKGRGGECETGSKTGSPGEDKGAGDRIVCASCYVRAALRRGGKGNERKEEHDRGTPWREAARSNRPTRLMVS